MHIKTAKEKVCPFSFTTSGNKLCIANECMAWGFNLEDGRVIGYEPDVYGTRYPVCEQVASKTDGYCKRLN